MSSFTTHHLVLARKWRPERFSELVGQEHVTRTLAQAIRNGRIAHAFLFTGIRGVGKTTAARIVARCLNCEHGPTPEPCGECPACAEIRNGRALDVVEIDGATYRKIDDARAIIENLSYRPARDRFKIYIIDEAHQLTDQAFNALLKTLEEPPPHVKFILATTEPQKMPETILSRLQRYDFRRIPFATILARMQELVRREDRQAEGGALTLIAREAGGSMRDAERMLETAIALSAGTVSEGEVAATLGVASRARVYALCQAILEHNAAGALGAVRELNSRGANLEALGRDLLETLRNLAVAKLPAGAGESPFAELPDQEVEEIKRLAAAPSLRDLMRLFRLMAQAQEEILRSPYPDLLMEMAAVRMATLAPVVEADELLRAIGAAEKSAPAESSAPPASRLAAPPAAQAAPPATRRLRVNGEVKADAPRKAQAPSDPSPPGDLPELRDYIRARRAPLAGFMEQGAGLELAGDVLRVHLRNDIYIRYLGDNRSLIAELASECYGRKIAVEFVTNGAGGARSAPLEPYAAPNGPAPSEQAREPSDAQLGRGAEQGATGDPVAQDPARRDREQAREALYADPVARKIFEELQGRLVDIRPAARRRGRSETEPSKKS